VKPAALLARAGVDVAQRGPRTERAVTDDELGLVQPAALHVPKDASPALGALPVAVLHGEELLLAVLAHADHDQQAHLRVLAEPDAHVDAVMNR
jgi:hypothetical protein